MKMIIYTWFEKNGKEFGPIEFGPTTESGWKSVTDYQVAGKKRFHHPPDSEVTKHSDGLRIRQRIDNKTHMIQIVNIFKEDDNESLPCNDS